LTAQAVEQEMNVRMLGGPGGSISPPQNAAELCENMMLCSGNLVIALSTDFDYIVALDSRDGGLRWEAPLLPLRGGDPVRYCVGLRNGKLFLAGSNVIRRYDVASGRVDWEHPLYGSCGRAILTSSGLFVPEGRQIRRFDADSGADLGVTSVATPEGEPVGNLISDGNHLYSVGPGRISALSSSGEPGGGT
jgi:outer membrane protein assembly factor BamB